MKSGSCSSLLLRKENPHENQIWRLVLAGNGELCDGPAVQHGPRGHLSDRRHISDGAFITAMVLILLAIFFMLQGFAAEAREKRPRKIHQPQANTVKSGRKAG